MQIYNQEFQNKCTFVCSFSTEDAANENTMEEIIEDAMSYYLEEGYYRDEKTNKKVAFSFYVGACGDFGEAVDKYVDYIKQTPVEKLSSSQLEHMQHDIFEKAVAAIYGEDIWKKLQEKLTKVSK